MGILLRILALVGAIYGGLPALLSFLPLPGIGNVSANPLVGWPQIIDHTYEIAGKRNFGGPPTTARVLIAGFEKDEQNRYQRLIADQIARIGEDNLGSDAIAIMETPKSLSIAGQLRSERIRSAERTGRRWLDNRSGDVLIWGSVSAGDGGTLRFLPPTPPLEANLPDLPQAVDLPPLSPDNSRLRSPIIQSLTAIFTSQKATEIKQAQTQYYNLEHMTNLLRTEINDTAADYEDDQRYRTLRSAHFRLVDFVPDHWSKKVEEFENEQLKINCCSYHSYLHRAHARYHLGELDKSTSILGSAIADYERAFEMMPLETSAAERGIWLRGLGQALITLGNVTGDPQQYERASLELEKSGTYFQSTDYIVSFVYSSLVAAAASGKAGLAHSKLKVKDKALISFERAFSLYSTGLRLEQQYRRRCDCESANMIYAAAFLAGSDVAIQLLVIKPSPIYRRRGRDFANRADSLIVDVINKIDEVDSPIEWGDRTLMRARIVFNQAILQERPDSAHQYFLESAELAEKAAIVFSKAGDDQRAASAESWKDLSLQYAQQVATKSQQVRASSEEIGRKPLEQMVLLPIFLNNQLVSLQTLEDLVANESGSLEDFVRKNRRDLEAFQSTLRGNDDTSPVFPREE